MLEIFDKFALPTALIITLLGAIGWGVRSLWTYFTVKEKETQARLDANQEKFLTSLNNRDDTNAEIARALVAIKTDTAPTKSETEKILNKLENIQELIRTERRK